MAVRRRRYLGSAHHLVDIILHLFMVPSSMKFHPRNRDDRDAPCEIQNSQITMGGLSKIVYSDGRNPIIVCRGDLSMYISIYTGPSGPIP